MLTLGLSSRVRWTITSLLLSSSLAAAFHTHRLIATQQRTRFEYDTQRIDLAIQQRMQAYVQILRGGIGLFAASDEVTREDWRLYVESLTLTQDYPGIRSMSFVPAVPDAEVTDFVARVRASPPHPAFSDPDILRQFSLRPPPPPIEPVETTLHAPVLYTEPITSNTEKSLGVDMMLDAGRQATLLAALQRGDAVLSSRLRLLRASGTEVGFIVFMPVTRLGDPIGWLTAVFYAESFMRGLLGTGTRALDLEVYDGNSITPDTLLYSSAGVDAEGNPNLLPQTSAAFQANSVLEVPGRQWTVRYRSRPDFDSSAVMMTPWLVALGGLLASLLFHTIGRAGAQWREQAEVLRQAESAIRHQATHDPLTGLANRTLFLDRLEAAIERSRRRSKPFALVYIDIDGFKPVNDLHGHHVGDELLKAIGQRLLTSLRKEDTVARLGGDEFALILEEAVEPPAVALRLCNDSIARLSEPFVLQSNGVSTTVQVGASVGLALYPAQGQDCDRLIMAADSAMYRAKRSGKNRCVLAE